MKIINKIFICTGILAAVGMTSSCDLNTKSQSTFEESTVFADPTLTTYQIYSIYEVFGHTNSHRGRYLPWYGYNNDVEWYNSNTLNDNASIVRYNISRTNSQLNLSNGPYNELFTGIERANLTINGVRSYGNPESRPEMAALLGEALVMRAVLYTELMKAFGEVPGRFAPVDAETIYLNKEDKDVLYKQLLADLEEAISYLDWDTASTVDRVGKQFAIGMYARVALYASGYCLRPEDGMAGTGDEGSVRLSNDPELQKSVLYPKALSYLRDAIANGGLELMDYEELWKDVNNMVMTAGHEVIWVIPFSNTRGRWNYTFAIRNQGYTTYSPTTSNRGGQAGPVPYLYYWYGENDTRRDISCVNYLWEDRGNGTLPYPAGMSDWYFGKYRFEWMNTSPYGGGNDDGVKPVYMRYADLLLMAAEIANSSEGGARDESYARQCLQQVLYRAYAGHTSDADAILAGLTSEDLFFKEIQKQRALEFVGEFLRKADLIRWGENLLQEKMDAASEELQAMRNHSVGPITGFDYGSLGTYLWYRHSTADGIPSIEMYGIHAGENDATADTPPAGSGWAPYTDSAGEVTRYLYYDAAENKGTFISSTSNSIPDKAMSGAGGGFYDADPETHMWWPIFETTLTNSQGYLSNDYGY